MNEKKNDGKATSSETTAVRWLSEGLEELIREYDGNEKSAQTVPHFDLVIVGSGYGGALAADELAGGIDRETGRPMRICVLERGREYLAGMFPTSESDLPASVTFTAPNSAEPYAATDGIMDLRIGEDVTVMLASGLGGGSLINAGVMAIPKAWVFNQPCWPKSLRRRASLVPYYKDARKKLAPSENAKFATPHKVKKQAALFRLYPQDPAVRSKLEKDVGKLSQPTAIKSSIAANITINEAGVPLKACTRCGDCMTGCNHQAKNSLDQNLLVKAKRKGVRIVCGATVIKLALAQPEKEAGLWLLELVHSDPLLRRRQPAHFKLSTRRVILAAGTLGSTEILLRSRDDHLKFSSHLGERFSTNGDFIAASYGEREEVNAVADEFQASDQREIGPTITGMMKAGIGEEQITIEDLAVPGPLRRLFEEGYTTAHLFHRLGTRDPEGRHRPLQGGVDPYAVQRHKIARTQAIGIIGHDGTRGRLELQSRKNQRKSEKRGLPHAKNIVVRWPELRRRDGVFDKQAHMLNELITGSGNGGVLLSNPFWQLLPPGLSRMLDMPRGPAFTTHPLGGCVMADSWREGVVDEHGQVFDTKTAQSIHRGLVVLDGSIIPRSLGTNPAFTISAVVLRALGKLKADWQAGPSGESQKEVGPMPRYKTPEVARDIPTKVAICERLEGPLHLATDSPKHGKLMLEITLRFCPTSVSELAMSMARTLNIDSTTDKSFIRIFKEKTLRGLRNKGVTEYRCEQLATFRASLSGTMRLLDREHSWKLWRVLRGLWAWWHNRGKRDLWGWAVDSLLGKKRGTGNDRRGFVEFLRAILEYVSSLWHVASHAGEVRLFEYDLVIGDPLMSERGTPKLDPLVIPKGTRIRGTKRLTYERRSNPWRQMLEVTVTDISLPRGNGADLAWFSQLSPSQPTVLKLEPKHYARERKHLFEITETRDGVAGMFELFSFTLYVIRLVAAVHLWSFRKPDESSSVAPQRLPGELPGVRPPLIKHLWLRSSDDETKVTRSATVRLTRYRKEGAGCQADNRKRPVLLIHGYSASGTTFAHPALDPGLAKYLYEDERDVWVVDLRTSAGLSSSKHPWSFEQVAREDIPQAFKHILHETGALKIDVVAHCMGAAMFSMALLDDNTWIDKERRLVDCVGNVVLSQVGPLVAFTPANIFRAYAVSYIQQVLREFNFEFRPTPGAGSAFLDRLLATVPYPQKEFEFENPPTPSTRTSFTATRHRMDAWFGRAFNIANMNASVLDHIDDFFGGINLRTLLQTIHFARNGMITTRRGRNAFIIPERLNRLRNISFFSIHGTENGLADPATLVRVEGLMKEAGINFEKKCFDGFGHQDCIIGREAAKEVFPNIIAFLNRPAISSAKADYVPNCIAHLPFMGPLVGLPNASGVVAVAFAASPTFGLPFQAVWIPANAVDDAWRAKVLSQLRSKSGIPASWLRDIKPVSRNSLETPGWYQCSSPQKEPLSHVLVLLCKLHNATTRAEHSFLSLKHKTLSLKHNWHDEKSIGFRELPGEDTMSGKGESVAGPSNTHRDAAIKALRARKLELHDVALKVAATAFSGLDLKAEAELLDDVELRTAVLASDEMKAAAKALVDLKVPDEVELDSTDKALDRMASAAKALQAIRAAANGRREMQAAAKALRDLLRRTTIDELKHAHAELPVQDAGAVRGLRFALSSCQYPAGPLDPGLAAASYVRLGTRLNIKDQRPRCLILVGDQIYADATAGLFDPTHMDDRYELPYQAWLRTSAVRNVLRRVPLYATLDDHEIDNNWERNYQDPKSGRRRAKGVRAYFRMQRVAGPPIRGATVKRIPVWYDATIDGYDFFFVDSRSEREMRTIADLDHREMIDEHQMSALLAWLDQTASDRPRFVVCGSILLPRRKTTSGGATGPINSDAWDGYPATFHALLGYIANRNMRNLVFLSGDEHHSCIATARLVSLDENGDELTGSESTTLHSIHSSALYAPFPFANGEPAQLAGTEVFTFSNPELLQYPSTRSFKCVVGTHFVTEHGDGFAILDCRLGIGARWEIQCEFSRPGKSQTYRLDPLSCECISQSSGTEAAVVAPPWI